jgi:hypothetical protein
MITGSRQDFGVFKLYVIVLSARNSESTPFHPKSPIYPIYPSETQLHAWEDVPTCPARKHQNSQLNPNSRRAVNSSHHFILLPTPLLSLSIFKLRHERASGVRETICSAIRYISLHRPILVLSPINETGNQDLRAPLLHPVNLQAQPVKEHQY